MRNYRKSTLIYTWESMLSRCYSPSNRKYPRYGGRGIRVCERWRKYQNFLSDMGERPEGYTLDRIDNNGDYCPENCQWADQKTQNRNRSDNRILRYRGVDRPIVVWADLFQMSRETIKSRIKRGISVAAALETPAAKTGRHR
jgi:hypothetical protein